MNFFLRFLLSVHPFVSSAAPLSLSFSLFLSESLVPWRPPSPLSLPAAEDETEN